MKRIHYSVLIIVMALLDIGCTHKQDGVGLNLSVKEIKIDSWLNLMPGGPGSFHISGEIKLRNEGSYELKDLSLSIMTVKQNNKELYSFSPTFISKIEFENDTIPSETEKVFLYYNQLGMEINQNLDTETSVKIEMLFRNDDDSWLYEINDVKVNKVY